MTTLNFTHCTLKQVSPTTVLRRVMFKHGSHFEELDFTVETGVPSVEVGELTLNVVTIDLGIYGSFGFAVSPSMTTDEVAKEVIDKYLWRRYNLDPQDEMDFPKLED